MSQQDRDAASEGKRVTLCSAGVCMGDDLVPLRAGSIHYWRLETRAWKPALEAVKRMGLPFVDTYIPWGVHEIAAGSYDFGTSDPRLDVVRFIELAHELGLFVIARPGPH